MIFPPVPDRYNPEHQREIQRLLEAADLENRKTRQDNVYVYPERLVLMAPDGGLWSVVVDNAGALSTEAVP